MKTCKTCQIDKDITEFSRKNEKYFYGSCKLCKKEKEKQRKSSNLEFYKEKERLRGVERRKTDKWKNWRKDYESRNRKKISQKALEYYHLNDEIVKKNKLWKINNYSKVKCYLKKYQKSNPLKVRARKIVNYHVNKGNMTKPEVCQECNKKNKLQAHHIDYLKLLDIKWLCSACHGIEHRNK